MRRLLFLLLVLMSGGLLSRPIAWARHIAYGRYVMRHKWFVLGEGIKLGLSPWQALAHDWTKFRPDEWLPYARAFYNLDGSGCYHPEEFVEAWNHHQKRHPHHWQYWMLTWDRGDTEILPMPDKYRREMLADWRGAGRALGKPDTKAWYEANRDKMKLHPETRAWIEQQLGIEESD